MIKLREYSDYYVQLLRTKVNEDKKMRIMDTGIYGFLSTASSIKFTIEFTFKGEEYEFDLSVKTSYLEENEENLNKTFEDIKVIIEQIKIGNYDCREIKNNDKWDSVSVNRVHNKDIMLLMVSNETKELYLLEQQ